MQSSSPSPERLLRRCEQTAIATTTGAFLLTILLVTTGQALELNAIADTLFGELGWAATGIAAIGLVTLCHAYYERHVDEYPRLMVGAGAFLALAGVLDLVVNLYVLSIVGFPDSVLWGVYGPAALAVIVVGTVTFARRPLVAVARHVRPRLPARDSPTTQAVLAVAITLCVVVGMQLAPVVGLFATHQDHDGAALATDGEVAAEEVDSTNLGEFNELTSSESGLVVALDGDFDAEGSIKIFDSSGGTLDKQSETTPSWVSSTSRSLDQVTVDEAGDYIYIFDNAVQDLRVLDVSDAENPNTVDSVSIGIEARMDMELSPDEQHLYLGEPNVNDREGALVDVSDPENAALLDTQTDANAWALEWVSNDTIVTTETGAGLKSLKVEDDGTLTVLDRIDSPYASIHGTADGNSVYQMAYDEHSQTMLVGDQEYVGVYDFSDPANIELLNVDQDTIPPESHNYETHFEGENTVGWSNAEHGANGEVYFFELGSEDVHHVDTEAVHTDTVDGLSATKTDLYTVRGTDLHHHTIDSSAAREPLSGTVTDESGDPVEGATVVAQYDEDDMPTVGGTPWNELQDDPLQNIEGLDAFIDEFDEGAENLNDISNESYREKLDSDAQPRVVTHNNHRHWKVNGLTRNIASSIPGLAEGGAFGRIADDLHLRHPQAAFDTDEVVVLSVWEGTGGLSLSAGADGVDRQLPGETTPGTVEVERLDPLGDTEWSTERQTVPLYEVSHWSNVGWSSDTGAGIKNHHAVSLALDEGIYRASPEGSELETYFVVAPNGDIDELSASIENYASDRAEANSEYEQELEAAWADMNTEAVTTDANGEFTLNPPPGASSVNLLATKGDVEEDIDPTDLTLQEPRDEIEQTTRELFASEAAGTITFDQAAEDYRSGSPAAFEDACRQMDSVFDETGGPFTAEKRGVPLPNGDLDMQGQRVLTDGLGPDISACVAMNFAEELLDGSLGFMDAGLLQDLETPEEIREVLEDILPLLNANPALADELEDRTGIAVDSADPDDYSDGEVEELLEDGLTIFDDGSVFDGGDGSSLPTSGDDGVTVDEPDQTTDEVLDETDEAGDELARIVREWGVVGVDNWDDAEALVRIDWSNGTTTTLTPDDDAVTIDEAAFGADTVELDYELSESDPEAFSVRLDVATPDGFDGAEDPVSKNPTFDGDLPGVDHLRLSTVNPGPDEQVTLEIGGGNAFGALERVEVTKPDGTTATHQSDDGETATLTTGDAGTHRLETVVTNQGGVEFTTVLRVEARAHSGPSDPTIKAASSPLGRYALVSDGMQAGTVSVEDGASHIELVGVTRDDPSAVEAHTRGADLTSDATHRLELRKGDEERNVDSSPRVRLYSNSVSDDALFWRNGRAIPRGEQGTEGMVEVRDNGVVMDTFAEAGVLETEVVEDPSVFDRVRHWTDRNIPQLPLGAIGAGAVGLVALPAGAVAARRVRT